MKRKLMLVLTSCSLLAFPATCLTIDQEGLLDLGSNLACELGTSGLPYSAHLDYCSVVDIDLGAGIGD